MPRRTPAAIPAVDNEAAGYAARHNLASRAEHVGQIIPDAAPTALTRQQLADIAMFDGLPPKDVPWLSAPNTATETTQEMAFVQGGPDNNETIQLPLAEVARATATAVSDSQPARRTQRRPSWAQPDPAEEQGASRQQKPPKDDNGRTETTLGMEGLETTSRRRAHAKPKQKQGLFVTWQRILPRKVRNFLFN